MRPCADDPSHIAVMFHCVSVFPNLRFGGMSLTEIPVHPQVQTLRDAAVELRRLAEGLTTAHDEVHTHHQPDVWEGDVASRFGDELDEHRRRLLHPVVGTATALTDAAARLSIKADALAPLACPPIPDPAATPC